MREPIALLGIAASAMPPDHLRDRVLAEITRHRRLAPLATELPESRSRSIRETRWWSWRVPAWAMAAAAATIIALGGIGVTLHRELQQSRTITDHVAAVLGAPDARAASASSDQGIGGVVVVSRQRDRLVFLASGLAEVPTSRTYQLWLMGPDRRYSTGLLDPENGRADRVVTADLAAATAVGVTVEPAGGSKQPTTGPVLVVRLPPP